MDDNAQEQSRWQQLRLPAINQAPPLLLRETDVHVWRVALEAPPLKESESYANLSLDEQERASTYRSTDDRQRFVIGRGILRQLAASYLGLHPTEVTFEYGALGKPRLRTPGGSRELAFNVAHSGQLILLAFSSGRPVGIDVERLRTLDDSLRDVPRRFSPQEQVYLQRATQSQAGRRFFDLWTRKEAVAKAWGYGLALPMSKFSVCSESGPCERARFDAACAHLSSCVISSLPSDAGYASAIARLGDTMFRAHCWKI
ncbi:MAG TPA: 4'-phosphopantetheinyl transferase superfamily protein [Polyangiaceae bacterium]|nr:4'-phosphopantetheinyl transferase superfamily protein [Polyangiaceae bacterium]